MSEEHDSFDLEYSPEGDEPESDPFDLEYNSEEDSDPIIVYDHTPSSTHHRHRVKYGRAYCYYTIVALLVLALTITVVVIAVKLSRNPKDEQESEQEDKQNNDINQQNVCMEYDPFKIYCGPITFPNSSVASHCCKEIKFRNVTVGPPYVVEDDVELGPCEGVMYQRAGCGFNCSCRVNLYSTNTWIYPIIPPPHSLWYWDCTSAKTITDVAPCGKPDDYIYILNGLLVPINTTFGLSYKYD